MSASAYGYYSCERTHLKRDELDEGRKGVGCDEPDIVVRVAHAAEDGDDEEDDVGKNLDVQELDDIWREPGVSSGGSVWEGRKGSREMSSIAPRR